MKKTQSIKITARIKEDRNKRIRDKIDGFNKYNRKGKQVKWPISTSL